MNETQSTKYTNTNWDVDCTKVQFKVSYLIKSEVGGGREEKGMVSE